MGGGGPRSRASKTTENPPAFKKQKNTRARACGVNGVHACVRARRQFHSKHLCCASIVTQLGPALRGPPRPTERFFLCPGELNRRSCHHHAAYHYFARLLQQMMYRPRYQLTRSATGRRSFYGACVPSRADSAARRSMIGAALGGDV